MVKWVSFLGSLHWPAGGLDLGVGGVPNVELLILYEPWAGERLSLEKAHPRYLRPGRPISVSAVPCGPGIDVWRSCRFIGALMGSLCLLPDGLGRFVPCSIGANHCRLRHIGWEKAPALLAGTRIWACFTCWHSSPWVLCCSVCLQDPTWRLPVAGHVVDLVTASVGAVREVIADGVCQEVRWVSGSGPGRKRFDLTEKPLHTSRGFVVQSRPRVWKRLHHAGTIYVSLLDRKRRRRDQDDVGNVPFQIRTGVG